MTTYNFPLGNDHDDRDFARLDHDLRTRPQRLTSTQRWPHHALRIPHILGRKHS